MATQTSGGFWHLKNNSYVEKDLITTITYGDESLMLWGFFACIGPGALVKVNGIMNFTHYQDISAENLVASAWKAETWPQVGLPARQRPQAHIKIHKEMVI